MIPSVNLSVCQSGLNCISTRVTIRYLWIDLSSLVCCHCLPLRLVHMYDDDHDADDDDHHADLSLVHLDVCVLHPYEVLRGLQLTGLPEMLLWKSASVTGFFLLNHTSKYRAHLQSLMRAQLSGKLHVALDPTLFR
jgi:hypothetical protein